MALSPESKGKNPISFFTFNRILFLCTAVVVPLAVYALTPRLRSDSPRYRLIGASLLVVCSALLTFVLTYPVSWHPSDHVVWILDSRFLAYVQAWDCHSLWHPSRLFNANIFFPARNTLAFSENLLGNVPLFAPVYWATHNAILGYNVVTLATFFFSALTMFWLVRHVVESTPAAAVAAFVYAFAPARIFQMERVHIISEQWAPLVVLFAYAYLNSGRRRWWAGFAAFLYLQILSSLHGGMFTLFITFIYVSAVVISARTRLIWRRAGYLVAGLCVAGLALAPIGVHYWQTEKQGNLSDYSDPIAYSATPTSYLNGGINHFYHTSLLRFRAENSDHEKRLFFGVVPWLLAVLAVSYILPVRRVQHWIKNGELERGTSAIGTMVSASVLTVVTGFVLSLGPYLQWKRHVTRFSLPYLWLSHVLPGFSVMRSPARFAFMALFGVAVLAGIGAGVLLKIVLPLVRTNRRAWSAAIVAELICVLFWEFLQAPLQCKTLPPALTGHGEYAWLASQPAGSPTLELPTSTGDWSIRPMSQILQEVEYTYASTYHWQPLVNGFSGHIPHVSDETSAWAVKLPAPEAITALRQFGIHFIVLHANQLTPADRARWEALPPDSGLRKTVVIDQAIIYTLEPSAAMSLR